MEGLKWVRARGREIDKRLANIIIKSFNVIQEISFKLGIKYAIIHIGNVSILQACIHFLLSVLLHVWVSKVRLKFPGRKVKAGNLDCGKLSQQDNTRWKKNLESKNRHSSSFQTQLNKDEAIFNQLLFSVENLHLSRDLCDRNDIMK